MPNASSVIITESSSLIRRLIDLQKEIDVPSQQVATRFIKVQYADVQELSETLNEILNAQNQSKPTAGTQRVQGGAPAAPSPTTTAMQGNPAAAAMAAAGGDGGSAGEDIPIQIVPATRTNEIFAMGRPIDIVFVETLVRGFDSPTDQKNFLRRKLKFLAVADFLPVAESALQRAFGGNSAGAAGGPVPRAAAPGARISAAAAALAVPAAAIAAPRPPAVPRQAAAPAAAAPSPAAEVVAEPAARVEPAAAVAASVNPRPTPLRFLCSSDGPCSWPITSPTRS